MIIDNIEIQIIYQKNKTSPDWFNEAYSSVVKQIDENHIKVYEGSSLGILELRQHFISQCKAPLLGWVDDDDILQPGALQKCRYFLSGTQNKEFCGVFTGYYELDEQAENKNIPQLPIRNMKLSYSRDLHLEGTTVPDQFMLFRTSAARNALNIPSRYFAAREFVTDLIAGYALQYGNWRRLYEPLYVKRKRANSLTSEQDTDVRSLIYTHLSNKFKFRNPKELITL